MPLRLSILGFVFSLFSAHCWAQVTVSVPGSSTTGNYTVSINNAYQWDLYEKTSGSNAWRKIGSGGANTRNFSVEGRETGYYRYRVYNCYPVANGCGYSNTDGISVDIPYPELFPPSLNVPTTDSDGNYNVSWAAVEHAETYWLWEQFNGGVWVILGQYSATTIGRSGRADGVWSYRARSCANNSYDCSESFSTVKSVKVARSPGIPASVVAPSLTDGSFKLSWTASTGNVAVYKIDQQKNSGSWAEIEQTTGLSKDFVGLGLGTYRFRVRACNDVQGYKPCSDFRYSSNVTVAKPSVPLISSLPVTNNTGSYSIVWGSVPNTRYFILEEQKGAAAWQSIYSGSQTTLSLTGKSRDQYSYRVTACNSAGCSARSAVRSVSVAFSPGMPSSITTPAQNYGSFTVSWGIASGSPTSYELYRSKDSGDWELVYSGSGISTNFTNISAGLYQHKVVACSQAGTYKQCSAGRLSSVTRVLDPSSPIENVYDYDALGRLIKIYEDGVVRSHYCYDDAGNRIAAGNGGSGNICPGPAAPTGLSVSTYRGAFVARWNKVESASYYLIKHTSPSGSVVVRVEGRDSTFFEYAYPDVNQTHTPIYLKACNANACSEYVYF